MLSRPKRRSSWALRFLFSSSTVRVLERPVDGHFKFVVDQRLGQEVEGAGADRFDRRFDGAVARDQDDRQARVILLQWAKRSKPSPSPRRMSTSSRS